MIIEICEFLTDGEKIKLSMVSKMMNHIKCKLTYYEKQDIKNIIDLPYFDNFVYVEISKKTNTCPKFAKYVRYNKNNPCTLKKLPLSVIHLRFYNKFAGSLYKIPSSITHLKLGSKFYRYNTFPEVVNITHLRIFSCTYFKNVWIPPSVKHLKIYNFDRAIEKCIPESVTHLTLVYKYLNMPTYIPTSITHLYFHDKFDSLISNLTMPSVTHLTFGNNFNNLIINMAIPKVTHLTFGNDFNHRIMNIFMPNVTHLTFGNKFNQIIINTEIPNITHITFGEDFNQSINDISQSVIWIAINKKYNKFIDERVASRVEIVRI